MSDRHRRADRPRAAWRRRLVTVPGILLAWGVCVATAPLWIPAAAIADALRPGRAVALRCAAFLAVFLTCEVVGMTIVGALWLWRAAFGMDPERWIDRHFALETWWASTLFGALVRIFDLRLEVEGSDAAALDHPPYVLLLRHVSSGDTLLAAALVSRATGVRFRYVLKKELLWDPCLDIVGNRTPNVFVDRFSDDATVEIAQIRSLAEGLGPDEGLLIYPEGTRFSEAKRARAIERLAERGQTELATYARSLAHVLPPRSGGTLALLDGAPAADVVFCAHTGFEGAASLGQIWRGDLVGRTLRVGFRRVSRTEIPDDPAKRADWLAGEWRRVDAWVAAHADA